MLVEMQGPEVTTILGCGENFNAQGKKGGQAHPEVTRDS